jgi:hypothetical protein
MFMIDMEIDSYYTKLGISPNATIQEINDARNKLGYDLNVELQQEQDPEEKQRISARLSELNTIGSLLANSEKRAEYDRENAHLRFLVPQIAAAPLFVSRADAIFVLHRIIQEFLTAKGSQISPLSDIERLDFTSDETVVALLERELERG